MTRYLSCDQAMDAQAGFAVVEDDRIVFTCLETYKGIKKMHFRERCRRFGFVLQGLIEVYKPDVVVTEIVRTYTNGFIYADPIAALSQLQGVMHVLVPKDIPIYQVNTSSWQAVVLQAPKKKRDEKRPRDFWKKLSIAHVEERYGRVLSEHESDALNMIEYVQLVKCEVKKNILELA